MIELNNQNFNLLNILKIILEKFYLSIKRIKKTQIKIIYFIGINNQCKFNFN